MMMQTIRFDDYDSFAKIAARGFTVWGPEVAITHQTVSAFLAVTGAPGDATDIPGVMLQAMLPKLVPGLDWQVTGNSGALNLGSPSIRFPVPAQAGAQLRGRSRLAAATRHAKGTVVALEFEVIETGAVEPCLRSTIELLYLGAHA